MVVVEAGRIREIGTSVPAGATLVDLSGQTLLPGLIDAHTHVLLQGDATSAEYDAQLLGESLPYRTLRATRAMRSRSITASPRCATSATRARASPTST